jgi:hypothetical protein
MLKLHLPQNVQIQNFLNIHLNNHFQFRSISKSTLLTYFQSADSLHNLAKLVNNRNGLNQLARDLECSEGVLIDEIKSLVQVNETMSQHYLSCPFDISRAPYFIIQHREFRKFWESNYPHKSAEKIQPFLNGLIGYIRQKKSFTENQCIDLIAQFSPILATYDYAETGTVSVVNIFLMTQQFPIDLPLAETISEIVSSTTSSANKICYRVTMPYMKLPSISQDNVSIATSNEDSSRKLSNKHRVFTFEQETLTTNLYGSKFDQIEIVAKMTSTIGWLCIDGPSRSGKIRKIISILYKRLCCD